MKALLVVSLLALFSARAMANQTVTYDTLDFRNIVLTQDRQGNLDVRVTYDVLNSTTSQVLPRGVFDITANLPVNTVTNLTTLYNAIKNRIATQEGF